eukprot:tig00021073_g18052.t1
MGNSGLQPYTVVVTGCSSGIGQDIAVYLAQCGFTVLAGVRKDADGARLKSMAPERLVPIILDVTNEQHLADLRARISSYAEAPGGRIGLVCNAGLGVPGPFETCTMEDHKKTFDVNVLGLMAVTHSLLPAIRRTRGRLVFVSSMAGRVANPYLAAYSASKFAVEGLADGLRRELRHRGIGVVLVEPGMINTPNTALEASRKEWQQALGRSPMYEDDVRRMWAMFKKMSSGASSPRVISNLVLKALRDANPNDRYRGGKMSSQMAFMACLPICCADGMLASNIGGMRPAEDI